MNPYRKLLIWHREERSDEAILRLFLAAIAEHGNQQLTQDGFPPRHARGRNDEVQGQRAVPGETEAVA